MFLLTWRLKGPDYSVRVLVIKIRYEASVSTCACYLLFLVLLMVIEIEQFKTFSTSLKLFVLGS